MTQQPMRRSDRATTSTEALALLQSASYGVLSCVGADGLPYGVPMSYVYLNDKLYLHCAQEGRKLDYLRANPAVSFCVVGATRVLPNKFSTEYESVIVAGLAHLLEGAEKETALIALLEKYSPAFMAQGLKYLAGKIDKTIVICIQIDQISGKARR